MNNNIEEHNFPKEKSFVWLITQYKEVLIRDYDKSKKALELEDLTLAGLNEDILLGNIAKDWRIFCSSDDLSLISSIHTIDLHCKTYVLKITLNNEHRRLIQSGYSCHFYPYHSLIDEVSYMKLSDTLKESFILLLEYIDRNDD